MASELRKEKTERQILQQEVDQFVTRQTDRANAIRVQQRGGGGGPDHPGGGGGASARGRVQDCPSPRRFAQALGLNNRHRLSSTRSDDFELTYIGDSVLPVDASEFPSALLDNSKHDRSMNEKCKKRQEDR